MKKYQTAKELLATKAENKEKKPIYATRKLSIGLVSCMLGLLMAAPIARAEELPPAPVVEAAGQQEASAKVEEDLLTEAEIKEIKDRALNLGDNKYVFTSYRVDELKERLRKIKAENPDNFAQLKKETIDKAIIEFIPANRGEEREIKTLVAPSITGTLEAGDESISVKFAKNKDVVMISRLKGDIYAYVNVNGIDNIIKLKYINRSFNIKLTTGLKVDKQVSVKIVVTEKNNNRKILGESPYSNKVTVAKKPDPMDQTYKDIVIPKTTIYVNSNAGGTADYEIKKAIIAANKNIEAYKNIGDDLKKVTYKAATKKATLKFRDKKELEIDVSSITVADVVASKDAVVNKVTVGDTTITGKLDPYIPGTKVNIYLTDGEVKPNDAIQITVDNEGNFTYQVPADKQDKIGKVLKGFKIETIEPGPGKKESVKLHRVQPKAPDKTDVRDPKNLTETEKGEIEKKIRDKNSSNDQSLLPDGTGFNTGKSARIIFENGNVIIKDATSDKLFSDPIKIADIVNDIKPDPPTITAADDKLTFAPKSIDTDAKTITINYYDPQGTKKTATITKNDGTWTSSDDNVTVDGGVISLLTSKVNPGSTVTATVTDNAGQTSEPKSQKIAESVKPPTVTPNQTTGDVTITPPTEGNVDGMEISYIPVGEGNTPVIVKTKKEGTTWQIDGQTPNGVEIAGNTGVVTIKKGTAKEKSEVKAKSKLGTKESTDSNGIVPDKTGPEAPEVKVKDDGSITITPKAGSDTNTVTVTYKDNDGNPKTATATKGTDGTWIVTGDNGEEVDGNGVITIPAGKSYPGNKVEAKSKDQAGNESDPGKDITNPDPPTVVVSEDTSVTITPPEKGNVDGMEISYIPTGESNTPVKVIAKKKNNTWTIDGQTPEGVKINQSTGVVNIEKGKAKEKQKVTAISKVGDKTAGGKDSKIVERVIPDKTAPEAPTVKLQDNGSVKITPKEDSDTKTVEVNYKDPDGNKKTVIITKGTNGTWTKTNGDGEITVEGSTGVITIPKEKLNPGDKVTAIAKDEAGNPTNPVEDTAKPAPPKIEAHQDSGDVTITPPDKGIVDGMVIKYTKPNENNPTEVKVKKENGNWTFDGNQPDGVSVNSTTGVVTISRGKAKEKTPVKADSTVGNLKTPEKDLPGYKEVTVPDKTAPEAPEVTVDENTGILTITPPSDDDTTSVTVTYKKKDDGSEIKLIAKKGADKKWTLTKEDGTPIDNGESVDANSGVITLEKGKYKTGEEVVAFGNDDVNNQSEKRNATPVEVSFNANTGGGSMESKIVVVGKEQGQSAVVPAKFTLPECKFTAPDGKEFAGWLVGNGTEAKADGTTIDVSANITLKASWKQKTSSGTGTGTTPGSGGTTTPEPSQPGETTTPEITPEPSQPDNPTDPAKNNPDPKDKPEDKKTGEDNKNNPKTPNVEKGDKVINVGDKEVVVPKVVVDKKKGKLDKEERTKIAEKIKQKNPDIVDVKIDENANAYVTFNDGRRERIPAKDLVSKEGFVIPRRDRHSQDESPNRRRAGKNVKTGVESIAGIACTLVASTGALYIGRKKED